MIRVIFETGISSTYITKEVVWYPEITKKADEYYDYLYHESNRTNGLMVITYSPTILTILELISLRTNIELIVELNGREYKYGVDYFSDIYKIHNGILEKILLSNLKKGG